MVADDRQGSAPLDDRVIGGKVVNPEETLTAELDGVRHEVEHGDPDRHLDEHRQTAGEWRHAVFAILSHHSLLLLHGILRFVVLLRSFVELRFEHTHLSR